MNLVTIQALGEVLIIFQKMFHFMLHSSHFEHKLQRQLLPPSVLIIAYGKPMVRSWEPTYFF